MELKLSCADFTFPLLSHDLALKLIKGMGFTGVDIGLLQDRSHIQPSDQFTHVEKNAAVLREKLRDMGLAPSDVFLQASLDFAEYAVNHFEPARRRHARDLFEKTVAYTAALGCDHISILPGVAFTGTESYEASFARCVDELSWRVDLAKKAGLLVGVEAHIGSIVEPVDQAERLMKAVPGLGLTLDYSHFVYSGQADTVGDVLIPYANHMHARGAKPGVLQAWVSESTIDYDRIMGKMKAQGYDGWVCMEYCWTPNWEDCARNDNVSETVLQRQVIESAWAKA